MASKHPHILRTTCTATALSVMLAACGGGGGSERDKAVSASPVAPTPTQNIVAAAPATPLVTTPQNTPAPTGQVNTPANRPTSSVQPAPTTPTTPTTPTAPQNQTTTLPPTTLAPTQPVAQADTKPAPTPTPAPAPESKTVPNISGKGVRGDVLLAMIEQHACGARMTRSTTYEGSEVGAESIDTPNVFFRSILEGAGNYTEDPNDWGPGDGYVQRECRRRFYKPVTEGTYNYALETVSGYGRIKERPMYGEPWLKRGFNGLKVSYTVTVRDKTFSIGPSMQAEATEDIGYTATTNEAPVGGGQYTPYFNELKELIIDRDSLVSFGTLREWGPRYESAYSDNAHRDQARIMLIKSGRNNQARLCTNVEITYVKRLICSTWEISKDWKWGEELKYVGSYIVDDRSTYPREVGIMYWRQ